MLLFTMLICGDLRACNSELSTNLNCRDTPQWHENLGEVCRVPELLIRICIGLSTNLKPLTCSGLDCS